MDQELSIQTCLTDNDDDAGVDVEKKQPIGMVDK